MEAKRPVLFQYDDFRVYLRDWFAWMKSVKSGFSHRVFSRLTGFKAPNQLLLVIQGKRNVALNTVGKYFTALKLKQSERKYFELLVKFNQADDMVAKNEYFRELSTFWLKKGSLLEPKQQKYLSNWYYAAIREMVNLKDFKEDGYWIARRLGGLVTPPQARRAFEVLLELGLLKRNEQGKLVQDSHYVTTGDEIESVGAYLYHDQMIKLARESLRTKPSSERNLTALTFTMRKADYESVVAEIHEFRKKLVSLLQNRPSSAGDEILYQLNIHLFPMTKE